VFYFLALKRENCKIFASVDSSRATTEKKIPHHSIVQPSVFITTLCLPDFFPDGTFEASRTSSLPWCVEVKKRPTATTLTHKRVCLVDTFLSSLRLTLSAIVAL
jgi:hypothetical protein